MLVPSSSHPEPQKNTSEKAKMRTPRISGS